MNGKELVSTENSSEQSQSVRVDSLILNKNNSLRILIEGSNNASITVSIVESDNNGTVLAHKGSLGLSDERQITHVQRGDINIFDPFDSDSLGGLKPFSGERVTNNGTVFGAVSFNHGEKNEFQAGVLLIELKNSENSIENLLRIYDAEVIEAWGNRYLIKINPNKAPLENLGALLFRYNQIIPDNIQNVTFSSLESLRTFAIYLDIIFKYHELLKDVELNSAIYSTSCPTKPVSQDWDFSDVNLGRSWWLVDTHVASPLWNPDLVSPTHPEPYSAGAWDYSIGTGIKVAVIDSGFDTVNPEISRRVRVGPLFKNVNPNPNADNVTPTVIGGDKSTADKDHGHVMVMVGFAEKDNDIGTSGSAPNTELIPYSFGDGSQSTTENAIRLASQYADIISMSFVLKVDTGFFCNVFGFCSGQGEMDRITEAINSGKVVVVSAGNQHDALDNYIPAKHPNVIPVGAVGISNINTRKSNVKNSSNPYMCADIPAPFGTVVNPEALEVTDYSNFKSLGNMLWAPGEYIKIQPRNNQNKTSSLVDARGTSSATPFVAGVIALMKSRNPLLSPFDIKTILLNTADNYGVKVTASQYMISSHLSDVHLINAEAAVKKAIEATSVSPADLDKYKAATFLALVDSEPNFSYRDENNHVLPGRKLRLNQFVQLNPVATEREKQVPEQTVSHEAFKRMAIGKVVRVKGWSDVTAGREDTGNGIHNIHVDKSQIEISEVEEICDMNQPATCAQSSIRPDLRPVIKDISFGPLNGSITPGYLPSSSAGFKMRIQGKNLIASLNGSENLRFLVEYVPFSPSTGVGSPGQVSAVAQSEIESIANDGSEVLIRMPSYVPPTASNLGKGLPSGNFAVSLSGLTTTDLFYGSQGFSISADSSGSFSGFHIELADAPPTDPPSPPPLPPSYISLWLVRDTHNLTVHPDQLVGVAINDQDLSQLEIEVVKGDQH